MYLLDYGDEPIKVLDCSADLLPILGKNYDNPMAVIKMAREHPGVWYPTSPFSVFCYVEATKSPYRT